MSSDGSGGNKGDGIQRAATISVTPPQEQRRATITDASTVAEAFKTGNAGGIKDLIKKHDVRTNLGANTPTGSHTVGVYDTGMSRDRRDSKGQLREMKTFELRPNPDADTPQFQASYNSMTMQQDAWSDSPGKEELQMGNMSFGSQKDPVEITPRLTGCSIVEDAFGNTGHAQPFGRKQGIDKTSPDASLRSATHLKANKDIKDVFGPQEYGRAGSQTHLGSNAFMFKNQETGDKTLLHQDIYRDCTTSETSINVGQQSFGRRYRMGPTPPKEYGSMRPPRPK